MSNTTELLQKQFEELQKKYEEVLPKVDPKLITDLLLRQMENPRSVPPIYMVETFLEPGTDIQKVRETILQETGMAPAIYDNGTHIAVRHPLTLDMLERISNREGVIEVTGEYDTGSWAASHEHSSRRKREEAAQSRKPPANTVSNSSSQSAQATEINALEKTKSIQPQSRKETHKSKYLVAVYTAAGIIGAIALAGFIISGGMLPNSNSGIQSSSSSLTTTTDSFIGNEPGVIHGYVEGLSGLPAIGASVIAENLQTGQSTSAFVSLTGDY
ncbi:MAG: carboxypeptidase-like regulatory domain-containing protein, partial [Thermoproteota archaeon]|nr:carboxypeptidase-like regulatory domain-containing protein [Thermoproteota archaeon]